MGILVHLERPRQNVGMEVEYLGLNWKQGKELIVKTEGEGQVPGEKVKV